MDTLSYPRLVKRVRAVLIDSVLVPLSVLGTLFLGNEAGVSSGVGKVMLLVAPIFVLEPGLVALTGGTIGHHLQRIRVATLDGKRNINIFAATIRFIVKVLLGWLSFIVVLTTTKHQAVHDLLARSVVIHKDITGLPTFEVLQERHVESPAYVYPPAWRRVLVILGYAIVATFGLGVAMAVVSTEGCLAGRACTTADKLWEIALSISWLAGLGWIAVRGWGGFLYGCRRRPREIAA
jgi:uncharacterized RDD family membrane protein YckC